KSGMLHSPDIVRAVAKKVKEYDIPLVVDPVMTAESGGDLLNTEDLLELVKSIGNLPHEINNPLSTIKLNLELLAEDLSDADENRYRRNLNRIRTLLDQVQCLQDFLREFRKYVGSGELQSVEIDLRRIIEELTDFYRPQAEGNHVVLRSALPAKPVPCRIDAGLIKQAILNLIINATQAMSAGGELLLRLSSDADRAVLEVIDTGPGIEAQLHQKIFDPYYSTTKGGSGLGLPTARRIIRRHDGDIRLDSEPGKGTRFVTTLPLAKKQK
ncbi:MAG: ATP-binding protein, partial [Planctomycetota bacterium]|nr:ATP-binding protein [Planctomycetota bacterium]